MIWSWITPVISVLTTPLRAVLPTYELPFADSASSSVGNAIGSKLALINWIFPVLEVLQMVVWMLTYLLPAVIAYVVGNWVWRHVPQLWGFGPGSG